MDSQMDSFVALQSFNFSDQQNSISTSTPASLQDKFENLNFPVLGPPYTRNLRIALLTVMLVTAFFGNVAVIINISMPCRQKLRRIQILFINLAVADLLVCLFTVTSQLIWECMGREWVAGDTFCSIFKVLQTFTMVCSNYLIVSVALDRYFAVVHPLRRRPQTIKYVLSAWFFSLLPSYPNFHIFHQYIDPSGRVFCVAKFYTDHLSRYHRQIYMALILTSVFILPICIIIVVYARIVHVVWTRPRAFSGHLSSTESVASPNNCVPNQNSLHSSYPRAKIKTFWMTAIVVISFLFCTLPYFVLEIYLSFGNPKDLSADLIALLGIFSATNSSINPYVYLISNSKKCTQNKSACGCCFCCHPAQVKKESSRVIMSTNV